MSDAILFSGVSFSYSTTEILHNITFRMKEGEKVSIIGANGAGKSTTLKLATGLLRPKSGTVSILGDSPEKRAIKRKIGYLPEDASPYKLLSVMENIQYAALLRGVEDVEGSAEEMMNLFDLTHYRLAKAYTLSRGNLQRLSIAMTFVHNPDVLIMDEPLNYLDLSIQETVVNLVRKTKSTVLLSTHVVSTASRLTNSIMLLSGGRIAWQGTLDEIESLMKPQDTIESTLARMI